MTYVRIGNHCRTIIADCSRADSEYDLLPGHKTRIQTMIGSYAPNNEKDPFHYELEPCTGNDILIIIVS